MYEYKGKPDVSETNRTFAELIDMSGIADKQHAFAEEMRMKYYDIILYSISKELSKTKNSNSNVIRIPIDKNLIENDLASAIKNLGDKISEVFPYITNIEFSESDSDKGLTCTLLIDKTISAEDLAGIITKNIKDDSIKVKIFTQNEDGIYRTYNVSSVFRAVDKATGTVNLYLSKDKLKHVSADDWNQCDGTGLTVLETYYSK